MTSLLSNRERDGWAQGKTINVFTGGSERRTCIPSCLLKRTSQDVLCKRAGTSHLNTESETYLRKKRKKITILSQGTNFCSGVQDEEDDDEFRDSPSPSRRPTSRPLPSFPRSRAGTPQRTFSDGRRRRRRLPVRRRRRSRWCCTHFDGS